MKIDISLFISIVSAIIASTSVLFVYLNYKRQRRLDNENYLYKLKIDIYNTFIIEIGNLLRIYNNAKHELIDHYIGVNKLSKDELLDLAFKVDEAGYKLDDIFSNNQLLLSESIINEIEKFRNAFLYSNDINDFKTADFDKLLEKIYNHADDLLEEFRTDLKIELINSTLFRRIG